MSNHMKFCGQCGTQAPADGRVCGSCGHELGRQTASSPPEPARTEDPLVLSPGDSLARLQKARSRLEHKYKNSDGNWDLSDYQEKVVLFSGVVSLTFCLVGGQLDSVEGINGVVGGIFCGLILWPFVYWSVRYVSMPSFKKARADEADRLHAQEKAKEAASGWQSVTRVVCPHCQEAGGVQRFIPYEPPRDLLKEGLKWHLVDKTVGHVDVDPAEKIGRDIREASQKAQTPNMRCSNCTVEWRV